MNRRESFVGHTVVYAAVGASDAADLLRFPPEGSTAFAEELRLGSGADRFLIASSALMTWGAQRSHGVEVVEVIAGDGGHYAGVNFDAAGVPQPASPEDLQFSADGVPYLRAGSMVEMRWATSQEALQFRVVYTLDDPQQIGFALGSADERSVPGEVRYTVEHREDDSVWATVRGFLFASAQGLLGWKGRSEARAVIADVKAQLAWLAPGGIQVAAASAEPSSEKRDESVAATESDADADVAVDGEIVDTDETR